jgi:hypothetical protein
LANYLLTKGENDKVVVLEIRGTANDNDLKKSLIEMSLTSELTNSDKGLFHAVINPSIGEDRLMTPEQWLRAADIVENELRLSSQKRAIVIHEKKGRAHAHVVWERFDHSSGKMISDSFSRLALDRARKIMEQEFNHPRTPERNIKRLEIKAVLTKLWELHPDADSFLRAAQEKGYTVAVGTKRPYMVVDETGRSFDLVRQLTGVKTREVRDRFKATKLVGEKKAIALKREAQQQAAATSQAKPAKKQVLVKQVETIKTRPDVQSEAVILPANQNVKTVAAEKSDKVEKTRPPVSGKHWSMSTSFVIQGTTQEQNQETVKQALTKEEADKQKRQKIIDDMKRRKELAAKFRDNEQELL